MSDINNSEFIDLKEVFKKIWNRKKLFLKTVGITFLLSCIWILPQPRYYSCGVSLAPEVGTSVDGGSIGSIASSLGINIGGMSTNDAFYPMLYPDILNSTDFIVSLFDIEVTSSDGEIKTDYYTYLLKHQKKNMLTEPFKWTIRKLKKLLIPKPKAIFGEGGNSSRFNPFCLNEEQSSFVEYVRGCLSCSVDKKTEVVSITFLDQDRLICAAMTDSIREKLQLFITDYRTKKARHDLEYYEKLVVNAKAEYDASVEKYSSYCDSHNNMILQSYISERDALENDMQLAYQAYTAFNTQLQAARAKVQERTPAFTVLQRASVPQKPSKPKRMIFVIAMMFLAFVGTSFYVLYTKPQDKEC